VEKINQKIKIPSMNNLEVHKNTAMSWLIQRTTLSADRQKRQTQIDQNSEASTQNNHVNHRDNVWVVGLNSDVAVKFVVKGKTEIYVGRILRIRMKMSGKGKSWQEYTRDINLEEMRENEENGKNKVEIQCYYYNQVRGTKNKFKYTLADPASVTPTMIVGPINLTYIEREEKYVADVASMRVIDDARAGHVNYRTT
jgi:hypothetical protein